MMGLIRKTRKHHVQTICSHQSLALSSVNYGHVAANRFARHAAKSVNIGRNVVVASKSGLVQIGPTVLVATALYMYETAQ